MDTAKQIEHSKMDIFSPDEEVQAKYNLFCKSQVGEFAPMDSMGSIKSALNSFFSKEIGFQKDDPDFQRAVLAKENIEHIQEALALSRERYKKKVVEADKERELISSVWNVPKISYLGENYKKKNYNKAVLKPYFARERGEGKEEDSDVEVAFIKALDESSKVKWWYKNGVNEISYFGIVYKYKKERRVFYPDFIVQMSDKRVAIFDTKDGQTAEKQETKYKADALVKYIQNQNKKRKQAKLPELYVGIVISKDNNWRVNSKSNFNYNKDDLGDWDFLKLN